MFARMLHLFVCVLLAGPLSLPGWATVRLETRVGGSPGFSSTFASPTASQVAESHHENAVCGYDFASEVRKYLYAHANPVNGVDPSGHETLVSVQFTSGLMGFVNSHYASASGKTLYAARLLFSQTDSDFGEDINNLAYGLEVFGAVNDAVAVTTAAVAVGYGLLKLGLKAASVLQRITTRLPHTVCFTGDTEVSTPLGLQPISEIVEGDLVLAVDADSGRIECRRVTKRFEKETDELTVVQLCGETIETTPEHPFWKHQVGWIAASELRPGDQLVSKDGGLVEVYFVESKFARQRVYNLEVDGLHTFFVSAHSILVHNACRIKPSQENIVYREKRLFRGTIDEKKPFNQSLSNQEPIIAVRTPDRSLHIMQGNHRIRGAVEEGIEVEMTVLNPQQWKEFSGLDFSPFGQNVTHNPEIIPGFR
jgi:hypothetical protein